MEKGEKRENADQIKNERSMTEGSEGIAVNCYPPSNQITPIKWTNYKKDRYMENLNSYNKWRGEWVI